MPARLEALGGQLIKEGPSRRYRIGRLFGVDHGDGERIVMRMLDKTAKLYTLDEIGRASCRERV